MGGVIENTTEYLGESYSITPPCTTAAHYWAEGASKLIDTITKVSFTSQVIC